MENDNVQLIYSSFKMDFRRFIYLIPTTLRYAFLLPLAVATSWSQNAPQQSPADAAMVRLMIAREKALFREWELMEAPEPPPKPSENKSLKVEMSRLVIEKSTTQAEGTFHQILLALTLRDALIEVRLGLHSRLATLELDTPIPPSLPITPIEPGDDNQTPPPVWKEIDGPLLRERLERIQSSNDSLQGEVNALMSIETHLPPKITHDDISVLPHIPDAAKGDAKEAEQFFQNGDLEKAKEIFGNLLIQFPNSLYLLSNLAVIHLTQGNIPQAESFLRKCVLQSPYDSVSYSLLGITIFNAQKDEEALRTLARAFVLDPENPKTLNYLALVTSKKGWHSVAESLLRKSIEISPDYAEAHYNLAVLYALSAKPTFSLAVQHYRHARELGSQKNIELETILKNAGFDTTTLNPTGKP